VERLGITMNGRRPSGGEDPFGTLGPTKRWSYTYIYTRMAKFWRQRRRIFG